MAATSAWSVNEHMAVMAREDGGLMVLVAKVDHAGFGAESGAHPIPMSARGFGGWIHVDAHGLASDGALAKWVQRGIDFAQTLPRIDDF
ncbi:TfoX/Sxy family protein [Glycomyces harbinensis]|uniref:TfoX/Sxy family protein n=1 Tax=Glycomyces harbinensis TaxID=58114 RepID=UPI00115F8998|nr:TfoX/Sxy family protein [Glycomyces harbinensis]